VRSRTAGVMTTLMRNGRDRRSENPFWATAKKERVLLVGTDQRITSGPAATAAASRRGNPPRDNRPNTWLHPNASQKSQIPLAPRAPSIHGPRPAVRCDAAISRLSGEHRTPCGRGCGGGTTRLTRMYGPAVRCKGISSIWQMRSCINVSGLWLERCSRPSWISARVRRH
jgi:hypothetical protein